MPSLFYKQGLHGKNQSFQFFQLGIWSWLVMSSTWSPDLAWKRFLVYKLRIKHKTKGMKLSNVFFFCQGQSLVQILTSYHTWKFHGRSGCTTLYSTNHECKYNSKYAWLTLKRLGESIWAPPFPSVVFRKMFF